MTPDRRVTAQVAVPDYAEPILGWRIWSLGDTGDGIRLRSVVHPVTWTPREPLEAACLCPRQRYLLRPWRYKPSHETVEADASCGIYAVEHIERAAPYADYVPTPGTLRRCVAAGIVALWGRTVVSEHGWRAEFAYPVRLYVALGWRPPLEPKRILESLAAYGVPVENVECRSVRDIVDHLRHVEPARLHQAA